MLLKHAAPTFTARVRYRAIDISTNCPIHTYHPNVGDFLAGTAPTDTDRASTSGGGGSTSTSSTVSASTTSSIDGDVPAAVAPTAAHVKALKAAHQTAKMAARAAAASAAASAGRGGGAAAGAAAAVVVVADNACISDTFSAVDPTSRTAGPQRRKQHHNQQHQQHQQTGSTSGSADKHKEKKTRAKTKPCTFFPRGRCRYGDGCRFSHDVAHESAQEKEEEEEKEEEDMLEAHEAALDNAERIEVGPSVGFSWGIYTRHKMIKGASLAILGILAAAGSSRETKETKREIQEETAMCSVRTGLRGRAFALSGKNVCVWGGEGGELWAIAALGQRTEKHEVHEFYSLARVCVHCPRARNRKLLSFTSDFDDAKLLPSYPPSPPPPTRGEIWFTLKSTMFWRILNVVRCRVASRIELR